MILSNKIIRSKVNSFKKGDTKMKKRIMTLVLTCLLVVGLGIFATQTKAEDLKWKAITYIFNAQQIPVPDEEGHRFSACATAAPHRALSGLRGAPFSP
jgi:hypothetical protein